MMSLNTYNNKHEADSSESRVRYTVLISSSIFNYKEVLAYIGPKLGAYFAGACCEPVDGVWSADGAEIKTRYADGNVENGMRITVSVVSNDAQTSYFNIQSLIQKMNIDLHLGLNWVHVEEETVKAKHFSLID